MKILIDSTWCIIHEWKDGRVGKVLFNGRHLADVTFQGIIDQILTPSQCAQYVSGNDTVHTLSKKKEKILFEQIAEYS